MEKIEPASTALDLEPVNLVSASRAMEADGKIRNISSALQSSKRKVMEIAIKVVAVSVIVFVLWREFDGLRLDAALQLLWGVRSAMAFVFVPPLLQLFAETFGLAVCIPRTNPVKALFKVLPVRIGCDGLLNSLPAGVVVAETLRPIWLHKACKIPKEESLAACVMGKINMAAGEGLFLAVVMVLIVFGGSSHKMAISEKTLIPFIAFLLLVFAAVGYIYTGSRLTHLVSRLKRVGWNRWRTFLSEIEPKAAGVDATILYFVRRNLGSVIGSLAAFAAGWILLGLESYVILKILGQDVSMGQGLLMEGTAAILRIAFFFIPSALGATEAAYVSLIAGFGIPDAASVALAFIAIKRCREFIWIALGYAAMLISMKGSTGTESPFLARHRDTPNKARVGTFEVSLIRNWFKLSS